MATFIPAPPDPFGQGINLLGQGIGQFSQGRSRQNDAQLITQFLANQQAGQQTDPRQLSY